MSLFQKRSHPSNPSNQSQHQAESATSQTFILEPILTPSGIVDGGDDVPDPALLIPDVDIDDLEVDSSDEGIVESGESDVPDAERDADVDTLTDDISPDLELDDGEEALDFFSMVDVETRTEIYETGVFTVGESGQVGIDFLHDGGAFKGELAIFSLDGMDEFEPGSDDFIQEAAGRSLSASELGHVVISDATEGARFHGSLGNEGIFNSGDYQGVKTFSMQAGDEFGVMLVPNGTVEGIVEHGGTPLFSLATANPDDSLQAGQIVDVTGDGNTFVFEDLRVDLQSDEDFNDIIFQVRGATGNATSMDDVIAPEQDWRSSDLGQALIEYTKPYIEPVADAPELLPDIVETEIPVVDDVIDDTMEDGGKDIPTPSQGEDITVEQPEVAESADINQPETTELTPIDTTESVDEVTEQSDSIDETGIDNPIVTEPVDEPVDVAVDEPEIPDPWNDPIVENPVENDGVSIVEIDEPEIVDEAIATSEPEIPDLIYDPADDPVDLSPAITSANAPIEDQPLIGIIDTGFNGENPDIDYSDVTLGSDRIDGDNNPLIIEGEGNEHGTHILGLIKAETDNGLGIDGINDDAPVWIGRAVGSGKWAESLIEFVDVAKESGQPNAVVNLSMDLTQLNPDGSITTRYEFTPLEMAALEYARQNHVLISVASGNDADVMSALGQASQQFDNIITVGAAEQINGGFSIAGGFDRSDYSSYGEGLDIVAEAGSLEAPVMSTVGDGVGGMKGTSVATAKVTGAASQVWAANPDLSYRQVIDILKLTATDLSIPGRDLETGAGFLNMAAAIHLARVTQPEVYDPELQIAPTTWSGENYMIPLERAVSYPHSLKEGETLWGLAQAILGDGTRWQEITKDADGQILFSDGEAQSLPIGQLVYIPGNAPNENTTEQSDPNQARNAFMNVFKLPQAIQSNGFSGFLSQMFNQASQGLGNVLNPRAAQHGTGAIAQTTINTAPVKTEKTLAGKKIILDPGHGINNVGFDPGAVGFGTTEAIENLHQARRVAQHLRQLGATVTILDERLSLAQIGQRAAGHDIFVSLHQNAFNRNAQGHEVFSHPTAPAKDTELARAINSELDTVFPDNVIPNRGTKTANFSVLRNAPPHVPAVLVESLFIDAAGMSRANIDKAATAIARGIEKFFTGTVTGGTPGDIVEPIDNVDNDAALYRGIVNDKVGDLLLRFRTGAFLDDNNIIRKLGKGTTMQILGSVTGGAYRHLNGPTRNDWYRVNVNGQIGYVAAYYVDRQTAPSSPNVIISSGAVNKNFSRGQEWVTPNGYKFVFQQDGNVVLYNPQGNAVWATGTHGTTADVLAVQSDGNVVLYDRGRAVWATNTAGKPGAYLAIQGDGNVVVYSSAGVALFASGTHGGRMGTLSASQDWLNPKPPAEKPGYVNSGIGLNFRRSPSLSAARIRVLPNGTNLTILNKVSGAAYYPGNRTDWYKVRVGDTVGYVAAYYVKEGTNPGNGGGGSTAWQHPLPGYPVSSEYGPRWGKFHYGIDVAAPTGTPVKAAKPGRVVEVGFHPNGWGRFVRINHDGFQTVYAHLSSANVSVGQTVNGGSMIGRVGSTGFSTGPHLHFEVRVSPFRWKTDNRNPRNYINF